MILHWIYMTPEERWVGIAKKGRNSTPWRIGYVDCNGRWCTPHDAITNQFKTADEAQIYLDEYADSYDWRLYDKEDYFNG